MRICELCGKEIPPHWCQQGGLHVDCAMEPIKVFKVSLPGEKGGYIERDLRALSNTVDDMLRDLEVGDGYEITRTTMPAVQYFNLPEFEGF